MCLTATTSSFFCTSPEPAPVWFAATPMRPSSPARATLPAMSLMPDWTAAMSSGRVSSWPAGGSMCSAVSGTSETNASTGCHLYWRLSRRPRPCYRHTQHVSFCCSPAGAVADVKLTTSSGALLVVASVIAADGVCRPPAPAAADGLLSCQAGAARLPRKDVSRRGDDLNDVQHIMAALHCPRPRQRKLRSGLLAARSMLQAAVEAYMLMPARGVVARRTRDVRPMYLEAARHQWSSLLVPGLKEDYSRMCMSAQCL